MRIGKFAQRYGITQDTVRYYMDRGLLVARKKGEQYFFTKEDEKDMEQILEWKQLDFSLNSIQELLTVQRLSGEQSDSFQNRYRSCLEKKKREVDETMEKLRGLSGVISTRLLQQKQAEEAEKPLLGFPLTSLDLLVCPECGADLWFGDGSFQDHMVMEANVSCLCGYQARIHQGVFIDEASLRPKLMNDGPMPTKEEYILSSTPGYINYLYQTMAAMTGYLKEERPGCVLEVSNCSGFILMHCIGFLPEDTVFIVADYDLDRLMRLKRNLETYHDHKRFIFLAADYHRLPLARGRIDAMADFGMVRKLYKEDQTDLPLILSDLLIDGGVYIASSVYFGENSKHRPEAIDPEGISTKTWIKSRLEERGIAVKAETSLGPVFQEGAGEGELKDMELYQLVVRAVKEQAAIKVN